MSYPNNKRNEKKRKKSHRIPLLFMKTLFISLAFIVILLTSGVFAIQYIIKPPTISTDKPNQNTQDSAFHPINGEKDDMLIGNGLHAPEGFSAEDRKEKFYTFLLVGIDGGVNTDTIMVASYDGVNKVGNIVSIPRDSKVNVKRKVKKINAAYPAGTLHGGKMDGGINQLKREIKTLIGFVPDYYVCVDLKAFVRIVDAVGGVDVNVPMNMIYDDPAQNLHINISEGEQHLDGEDALKFSRYRKGNKGKGVITDYQRMENQHSIIKALLDKLLNPINILKTPEFVSIFTENVYSDIKPENMLWFADQLNRIKDADALSTYTLPTIGTSGMPMYYEYLDEDGIIELVNKTINPYKIDITAKDIDIINAE